MSTDFLLLDDTHRRPFFYFWSTLSVDRFFIFGRHSSKSIGNVENQSIIPRPMSVDRFFIFGRHSSKSIGNVENQSIISRPMSVDLFIILGRHSSKTISNIEKQSIISRPTSVDRFFILGRRSLGEHRRRMSGSSHSNVTDETIALCCLCIEAHYRSGRHHRESVDPITFASTNSVRRASTDFLFWVDAHWESIGAACQDRVILMSPMKQ